MTVKLIESSFTLQNLNRLDEFEIGSIGVIRMWDGGTHFSGIIVKRESFETIRRLEYVIDGTQECFTESYGNHMKSKRQYYIETLPTGTKLEITL